MRRPLLIPASLVLAALAAPRLAHAQIGVDFSDSWERSQVYNYILTDPHRDSAPSASKKSTRVPKRAVARMPATMAAKQPPDRRAATVKQYELMLSTYETIATALKLPDHDLAGAFALLVCASYVAYHDQDLPPAAVVATSRQLRDALGSNAAFTKLSIEKKQDLYEQVAILSTTIVVGHDQAKGDPAQLAQLRALGKQQLAAVTDPDRLKIDENGMSLGPRTP